jgi:hypothetical protein
MITGIHSAPLLPTDNGETMCIAWNWNGLVGIKSELLCFHRESGKRLLWTYRNAAKKQKPLFSFHSRNADWLGCYKPNTQETCPCELKPVTSLPITNDTGEALSVRLFEATF